MPLTSRFLSPTLLLPLAGPLAASHRVRGHGSFMSQTAFLQGCIEIDRVMLALIGRHEGLYQHNKSHLSTFCTYLRYFADSPRTDRASSTLAQRSQASKHADHPGRRADDARLSTLGTSNSPTRSNTQEAQSQPTPDRQQSAGDLASCSWLDLASPMGHSVPQSGCRHPWLLLNDVCLPRIRPCWSFTTAIAGSQRHHARARMGCEPRQLCGPWAFEVPSRVVYGIAIWVITTDMVLRCAGCACRKACHRLISFPPHRW